MSAPRLSPGCEQTLRFLQASSCFRGEVCASLPCACAETLAGIAQVNVEATPTKEDFAKWSRVWHDTCETMVTLLGLPGSGSPQELLAQVQAYVCDPGIAQKAGWQPIETKRADHFPVLIDGPYGIHTAFQDVTWTWYVRGGIELDYTPTHWRPLPERASNQGASK